MKLALMNVPSTSVLSAKSTANVRDSLSRLAKEVNDWYRTGNIVYLTTGQAAGSRGLWVDKSKRPEGPNGDYGQFGGQDNAAWFWGEIATSAQQYIGGWIRVVRTSASEKYHFSARDLDLRTKDGAETILIFPSIIGKPEVRIVTAIYAAPPLAQAKKLPVRARIGKTGNKTQTASPNALPSTGRDRHKYKVAFRIGKEKTVPANSSVG